MKYPEEVLTVSKKGKVEVRHLIDKGQFARYEYLAPETGKRSENKIKLVLLGPKKKEEEYFLIPLADGRSLMLPQKSKGERKLWDGKKVVDLL